MQPVVRMQMSKGFFAHFLNLIRQLFAKKRKKRYVTYDKVVLEQDALVEAEISEDEDIVILPDEATEEQAPVSVEEATLRKLIQDAVITREIKYLVVHCTGTSISATVSGILNYWRDAMNWMNPGYHLIYPYHGGFTYLHDFNLMSNGVKDFNSNSINISTIGGLDAQGQIADTMSDEQTRLVEATIDEFIKKFPDVVVLGHRSFPTDKACPCYDVDVKYSRFAPNVRRRL